MSAPSRLRNATGSPCMTRSSSRPRILQAARPSTLRIYSICRSSRGDCPSSTPSLLSRRGENASVAGSLAREALDLHGPLDVIAALLLDAQRDVAAPRRAPEARHARRVLALAAIDDGRDLAERRLHGRLAFAHVAVLAHRILVQQGEVLGSVAAQQLDHQRHLYRGV